MYKIVSLCKLKQCDVWLRRQNIAKWVPRFLVDVCIIILTLVKFNYTVQIIAGPRSTVGNVKVGRSKPPPVLTGGFNRLKPPRSICQKVVNTGQYESEWSIENFKGSF